MNLAVAPRRRSIPVAVLAVVALLFGALVALLPNKHAEGATEHDGHGGHSTVAALPHRSQVVFHDQMRKLWEDHVTWTRLAIVTFADGSASFGPTATRLLQNQVDIGDAIKPFYGDAAGNQLTALLHDHITIAVEIMQAAKAGDTAAFDDAKARWYANANQIADFLATANPRSWPDKLMRASMKTHLDQTLTEAADELGGDYPASIQAYDEVHHHILAMADVLSSGIMDQFHKRFAH